MVKNNLWKKFILISLLTLAMAVSAVFVGVVNFSSKQNEVEIANEIDEDETIETSLSLDWGDGPKVQATASKDNNISYDETYWEFPDGEINLVGGMNISFDGYVLKFSRYTRVPSGATYDASKIYYELYSNYRVLDIAIRDQDTFDIFVARGLYTKNGNAYTLLSSGATFNDSQTYYYQSKQYSQKSSTSLENYFDNFVSSTSGLYTCSEYIINLKMVTGYRPKYIYFGNGNAENLTAENYMACSTLTYTDKYDSYQNSGTTINVTPEQLDPTYNGTLAFKVVLEPIHYKLFMYGCDTGTTNYTSQISTTASATPLDFIDFKITDEINLQQYSSKANFGTSSQGGWILKVDENIDVVESSVTNNGVTTNMISVAIGGIDKTGVWKFEYTNKILGTETIDSTDDDVDYYQITHLLVGSHGTFDEKAYSAQEELTYSEFSSLKSSGLYKFYNSVAIKLTSSDSFDSSETYFTSTETPNYTIFAKYKFKYTTTVNVGSAMGDIMDTRDEPKHLSGVVVDGVRNTTSGTIYIMDDGATYAFMDSAGHAFKKYGEFGSGSVAYKGGRYYVYNYGHEIENWSIIFGGNYGFSSLSYASLEYIARRLDNLLVGQFSNTRTISMTPTWAEANITVNYKNDSNAETQIGNFDYNKEDYSLVNSVETKTGKTFYTYKTTSSEKIAITGNWNYRNLPHSDFQYNEDLVTYNLAVKDLQLDDIYKIDLSDVREYDSGVYKLTKGGYTFNLDTKYGTDSYNFNNNRFLGGTKDLVAYNSTAYPLIDNYIDEILDFVYDEYNAKIDTANEDRFEIFNKVFSASGEIDSTDATKKTFKTTATDPFYIYLANGQTTEDLPAMDTRYSVLTHWLWNNAVYFGTENFPEDAEIDKEDGGNTWELSETDGFLIFVANYSRAYYNFDVQTLFDNGSSDEIGDFGYVLFEITDNEGEHSGKYFAFYYDSEMSLYDLGASANLALFNLNTALTTATKLTELKLYAACDVTLLAYDYKTGYTFKDWVVHDSNAEENDYIVNQDFNEILTVTAAQIAEKGLNNGATIMVKAYYELVEYKLYMFYETSVGVYENKIQSTTLPSPVDYLTFTIRSSVDELQTYNPVNKPSNGSDEYGFGGWVLKDTADDALSVVKPDENHNYIQVSIDGVDGLWYFTYTKVLNGDYTADNDSEINYYFISQIFNSYGDFDERYIFAKWSVVYDVTVDNSNVYSQWKGDSSLAGAVSDVDTDNSDLKATIKIMQTSAVGTNKFMSSFASDGGNSTALAFMKSNEISAHAVDAYNCSYYVYNYGFEISAWKIYFKFESDPNQKTYYLVYDGSTWSISETTAQTDITILMGAGTDEVAAYVEVLAGAVDDYLLGGLQNVSITMVPIWKATEIKVRNEFGATHSGKITFANSYDLSLNKPSIQGKSLVYYSSTDDQIIALSGAWNYRNLSYEEYVYNAGVYTITVKSEEDINFVDNIYKISLKGVMQYDFNTYKIGNTNPYEFSSANYTAQIYDYTNNDDLGGSTAYKTYNSWYNENRSANILVENYIENVLNKVYEEYVAGIATEQAGCFAIFKKVFSSSGELDSTDATNKTFKTTATNPFYIYLVNGQNTSDLPIIDTKGYMLILWNWDDSSLENTQKLAFATENYEAEEHSSVLLYNLDGDANSDKDITDEDEVTYWELSKTWDDDLAYSITLNAQYFRKYFYIDVETLLDETESRNGYLLIHVDDPEVVENHSGKYLAIFNAEANAQNHDMLFYDLGVATNLNSFSLASYSGTLLDYIVDGATGATYPPIKIYANSDLSIIVRDQSKDINAMNSGNYDDMIGYRYANMTSTDSEKQLGLFSNATITDYIKNIDADSISDLGLKTATTITIKVNFEKINYSMLVEISDTSAGLFIVKNNGSPSNQMTYLLVEDMQVGDSNVYEVRYLANIGYEFMGDAFVLMFDDYNNKYKTLATYLDLSNKESNKQTYSFNFDGTWLRRNYYIEEGDPTYSVTYTQSNPEDYTMDMGDLEIWTEAIPFEYGVKIYDSTQVGETYTDGIILTYDVLTIEDSGAEYCLKMINGRMTVPSVGEQLTNKHNMWIFENSIDGKDYAVLNSRLFFPKKLTTQVGNYYREYEFLLQNAPTEEFEIDSIILSNMTNCSSGDIVPANCRKLFMLVEVRELYSITMRVETDTEGYDTNLKTRTTTIFNSATNSVDITIINGNKVCSNCGQVIEEMTDEELIAHNCNANCYYTIKDTLTNACSVVVFTYNGLTNIINSTFDEKRYEKVEYFLNENVGAMEDNEFVVNANSNITIKYTPNPLYAKVKYFVDGVEKTQSDMVADLFIRVTTTPNEETKYKVGDEVKFKYELVNADYLVNIDVNGTNQTITDSSIIYIAQDSDYDYNGININVNLRKKDNSNISVEYQLYTVGENRGFADDEYGSFTILVGGNAQPGNNVNIVNDRKVEIDISNMSKGYQFHSLYRNNFKVNDVQIDSNIITIAEEYNENYSGNYIIYLTKVDVSAKLIKNGDLTNWYNVYKLTDAITGKTSSSNLNAGKTEALLTGLYLGKEITLSSIEQDTERINGFYYIAKDENDEDIRVAIDGDKLKITSAVLTEIGGYELIIGFDIVKRYKLDLTIESGLEFVSNSSLSNTADGTEYVSGTYVDSGTVINFKLETLVENKYVIVVNGDVANPLYKVDSTYELLQDIVLNVVIKKATFGVNVNESVYDTLENYQAGTPTAVDGENYEFINAVNTSAKEYGEKVELNVKRFEPNDRRLHLVTISGNDLEGEIAIQLNGYEIVKVTHVVEGEETEITNATLAELGFEVLTTDSYFKIKYTVNNVLSINCEYALFKVISTQ